jgi:hypothetical protein
MFQKNINKDYFVIAFANKYKIVSISINKILLLMKIK